MHMKKPTTLRNVALLSATSVLLLAGATSGSAQTQVYSENFEVDHTLDGTWATNTVGGANPVNLYFDYSTVGIPSAPNSGGTTRGLKLQANLDPALAVFPSGVSVSPSGFSITENFEMTWDWWLNYNGPLNGGGSGSTQVGGAGFGTAGVTPIAAGAPIDCFFVGASGDGSGTSADYRVYTPAAPTSWLDASGVYAAGTSGSRNNTHPYYQTTFTPQSATNNCPAQLALYPQQTGLTQGGSAGMKWRKVQLRKVGNIITYKMDDLLIATIDVNTNGTFGGNNIVFGHFDINAGASTDVNATNLAFSLVDNIRITNFNNVVTITAPSATATEAGQGSATFTVARTEAGVPLTINYSVAGTATNGVDYNDALGGALTGAITFAADALQTNITIVPVDDSTPEAVETVILSINPSESYIGAGSASAVIVDNEPSQLTLAAVSAQMYERTNDYATLQVSRLGDTSTVFAVNFTFSGSAGLNADFYTNEVVNFEAGVMSTNFTLYPIADAAYEGAETAVVNLAAATGGEYTIGSSGSASILIVDANTAPEAVLFSENFDTDSTANWTVFEASNNGIPDYTADFNFPYTSFNIPPAPQGGGNGLFLTANKDGTASSAAVNVYRTAAQTFSGNYALRFNLFASVPLPSASATEAVLAGINHSGTKTNWTRSGGVPAGWTFDGLFSAIVVEGGSAPNYGLYSTPTTAGNIPTLVASQSSANLTAAFKANPYGFAGTIGNSNNPAGFFTYPIWVDVEIAQINDVITLRLNNTPVYSFVNTNAFKSGKFMLGYMDSFDSIGSSQSYVVIDNVRVVSVSGLTITSIKDLGANVEIDFSFGLTAGASSFRVLSAGTVNGTYSNAGATIIQLTPGTYRATVPKSGAAQFYRIQLL